MTLKKLVAALQRWLSTLNSDPVYSDFSEMAHDEAYQKLARQLTEEFAISDWEAFRLAEQSQ